LSSLGKSKVFSNLLASDPTVAIRGLHRSTMGKKIGKRKATPAEYYDRRGVMDQIVPGRVALSLGEELRRHILGARRTRRLQNLSISRTPPKSRPSARSPR